MRLFQVPVSHVGVAWKNGAYNLGEATKRAEREITPDQLKLLLLRGERTLLGVADDSDTPKAWLAVQVQTLPNLRTLFVYAIWAPGMLEGEPFELLKQYARDNGCEVIRGCCVPVVGRRLQIANKAKVIYSTYEIEVD